MFRAAVARNVRLFSTNVRLQKSATESVKDGLKAVDRTVSDAAVKGIEKGEQVAGQAKSAAGVNSAEAKGKANELAGEAKGKADELAGKAKGTAHEAAGKAQGTAEEVKAKI